jgi:hypothetical protein
LMIRVHMVNRFDSRDEILRSTLGIERTGRRNNEM